MSEEELKIKCLEIAASCTSSDSFNVGNPPTVDEAILSAKAIYEWVVNTKLNKAI